MDRLNSYRCAIKGILSDFASFSQSGTPASGVETVCLFDEQRDGYMVYRVGWNGKYRVNKPDIFIRIVDCKIWIEENWTETDFAQELIEAGVLKEDICIGFHHPLERELLASAVA